MLLLDDLGKYLRKQPNYWFAYVNGVYKDGYQNHPNGLNVIDLNNNDQVNFYYAPNKDPNPVINATAVVKIKVNIQVPGPGVDTLFDGAVTLTPGETFTKQAYNNATGGQYTINRTTPLGALDKVATLQGFTYNVTDSRWSYDQVLLLDDLGQYIRKNPNYWYAYVNGVYKDGYQNHPNGLNVIDLNNNDQVNFYYAPNKDPNPVVNATAVVKIKVNIGNAPPLEPDWTLSLNGAMATSVTQTFFEDGLACPVPVIRYSGPMPMAMFGVECRSGYLWQWLMTTRMSVLTTSISMTALLLRDIQSRFRVVMAGTQHLPARTLRGITTTSSRIQSTASHSHS